MADHEPLTSAGHHAQSRRADKARGPSDGCFATPIVADHEPLTSAGHHAQSRRAAKRSPTRSRRWTPQAHLSVAQRSRLDQILSADVELAVVWAIKEIAIRTSADFDSKSRLESSADFRGAVGPPPMSGRRRPALPLLEEEARRGPASLAIVQDQMRTCVQVIIHSEVHRQFDRLPRDLP